MEFSETKEGKKILYEASCNFDDSDSFMEEILNKGFKAGQESKGNEIGKLFAEGKLFSDIQLLQARKEAYDQGFRAGQQFMRDNAIEELKNVENNLLEQTRQDALEEVENCKDCQSLCSKHYQEMKASKKAKVKNISGRTELSD